MKPRLVVYLNDDDALLRWTVDQLSAGCRGFAIQRKRKRGKAHVATSWLDNFAPPGTQPHQLGVFETSHARPFRAFTWTDHAVDSGDRVRYRVVPMYDGEDEPRMAHASNWSRVRTAGFAPGSVYRAWFNRGFVISQYMSRYLDEHYPGLDRDKALQKFKANITADLEDKLRLFLSGEIRTQLVSLLRQVEAGTDHVYAALYEFSDEELVRGLEKLGPRAHIVLANGSITQKKTETSAEARKRDQNKAGRARLIAHNVDVHVDSRFVSPGGLAHNKFLVVTDAADQPKRVWTGSTNWTVTGLCTQLNNALLVEDADVAAAYLAQWNQLRAAASGHPATLATSNAQPTSVGGAAPKTIRSSVHFTKATGKVDLKALGDIVNSAQEGVLFLMFMPGGSGVLKDVLALAKTRPDLLIRGVVSELPKGTHDEHTGTTTTLEVTIVGSAAPQPAVSRTFAVVQPEGNPHPTAWWAAETTHKQFKANIGNAIIHSKVLVVDPFSEDPTVVTGSHNFSTNASTKNDENFIVIRGDRQLAEAYAVNIQSAWQHYAPRLGNPHADLSGNAYLQALLQDQRAEEHFWRLTP